MRLSNQDVATANYARKEKKHDPKAKKDSVSKDPNANTCTSSTKAPYICSRCQKIYVKGECWMDKMTCNGCDRVGHIKKFCKEEKEEKDNKKDESEDTTPEASTKELSCYLQRSASLPTALNCIAIAAATNTSFPTFKVILDRGATDHFFCNRDYYTTYTEYYHEFRAGSGQILAASGYGYVQLIMVQEQEQEQELGEHIYWSCRLTERGSDQFVSKLEAIQL